MVFLTRPSACQKMGYKKMTGSDPRVDELIEHPPREAQSLSR